MIIVSGNGLINPVSGPVTIQWIVYGDSILYNILVEDLTGSNYQLRIDIGSTATSYLNSGWLDYDEVDGATDVLDISSIPLAAAMVDAGSGNSVNAYFRIRLKNTTTSAIETIYSEEIEIRQQIY